MGREWTTTTIDHGDWLCSGSKGGNTTQPPLGARHLRQRFPCLSYRTTNRPPKQRKTEATPTLSNLLSSLDGQNSEKSSFPQNCLSAILGRNGCVNFMDAWKMHSFCRKNHVHKIPRFRGGGGYLVFFWWGGGADFIFMGARIFLILRWAKSPIANR